MTTYADSLTLADARRRYFEDNRFGADGGYGSQWVDVKIGPIPFRFPNTAGRVRAVRFHDLHHLVTGYRTSFTGEAEISAWELASGCADHHAARVINLYGLGLGVHYAPGLLLRAFVRGRHTRNLYRQTWSESLLQRTVGEVRRELGTDGPAPRASARDLAAFAGMSAAGVLLFLVSLALLPLAPLVYMLLRAASPTPPTTA